MLKTKQKMSQNFLFLLNFEKFLLLFYREKIRTDRAALLKVEIEDG